MSLSRAYELQRDVFFYIMNIGRHKRISPEILADLWKDAIAYENMGDLICEIVARGNITIEGNMFVFSTIGDFEASTLKYVFTLENQLKKK